MPPVRSSLSPEERLEAEQHRQRYGPYMTAKKCAALDMDFFSDTENEKKDEQPIIHKKRSPPVRQPDPKFCRVIDSESESDNEQHTDSDGESESPETQEARKQLDLEWKTFVTTHARKKKEAAAIKLAAQNMVIIAEGLARLTQNLNIKA
ncbi:hypothetical protein JOM56_012699 [Amanita muscaria]